MRDESAFLESYLPGGGRRSRIVKKTWQALNENHPVDAGVLSDEENISSDLSPALLPCEKPLLWQPRTSVGSMEGTFVVHGEEGGEVSPVSELRYTVPLALFSAENKLIVFHNTTPQCRADRYYLDVIDETIVLRLPLTNVQNTAGRDLEYDQSPFLKNSLPSVFSHNLVTNLESLTQSEWNSYVMLLPGFFYFPREIYLGRPRHPVGPNAWYMDVTESQGSLQNVFYKSGGNSWQQKATLPIYVYDATAADYSTRDRWGISHLGRVFAAGDGTVSATKYNSLARTLDTANEYRESNGWAAILTARSDGEEEITGIASYRSYVVVFKKHFMHEVRGTKNPFRVADVGAVGCIDHRSIAEVDGVLFFVSEDGVRAYTGDSLPDIISDPLKIKTYQEAVSGAFGHKYYLWGRGLLSSGEEESFLYVYDAFRGVWTKEASPAERILGFRETDFGFFALGSDGGLYRMDSGTYENQNWFAATDLWTADGVDVKRIKKAELFLEADEGATLSVYLLKDGERFSPQESRRVFHKTFSVGGEQYVRFHVRRGAFVTAKIVIGGVGKVILRHLRIWLKEGEEDHATTPRD